MAPSHDEASSDDSVSILAAGPSTVSKRKKRMRLPSSLDNAQGRPPKSSRGGSNASKRSKSKKHTLADTDSADDECENDIPDYLIKRREQFDRRLSQLKESGLRIPPTLDEDEISTEDLQDLEEKPNFKGVKAQRPKEDIQLPKSLGIIPAPIAQWLRPYQIEGVRYLHRLFIYQRSGLLCDDMGLGKTVQVIAFLTAAFGKVADIRDSKRMRNFRRSSDAWYPRILIICPGTLIDNWRAELSTWGWWDVDVLLGSNKAETLNTARAGRLEILITTYSTYRINASALNCIDWDCVIADECHYFKTANSDLVHSMMQVNSLCRIGLTGTAIQNSYEELWTLLNWTNPGDFGSIKEWRKTISEPLKLGQSHTATPQQLAKARRTARALVNNLLPPYLLRRMKTLIADQLPKKFDRVVFCPLTKTQAQAYNTWLESGIVSMVKRATELCDCGSEKKRRDCCHKEEKASTWRASVFPAIQHLQKLSNHLATIIPQSTDSADKQDRDLDMLQRTIPDGWLPLYKTRDSILHYSNTEFCGKWKILKLLLEYWHDRGDKVLIFSYSVKLLHILRNLFQTTTSYSYCYIDGSMSYADRTQQVEDFSGPDQFVFLISTKAGGTGLNITAASKVVIMDPNWNPAHDLQAEDRAYRIGQSRDVEVFRLISQGTIEEVVYARQIYKQQQANIGYTASNERRYFEGIQQSKDQKGEIFGLENLFAPVGENVVLQDIVNKTNVAESKAGVRILEAKFDEASNLEPNDETEDEMSQIAAMLTGDDSTSKQSSIKAKNSHDPVQAILAGAGVSYIHDNSEIIGSSKIEEQLSRDAEKARQHDSANVTTASDLEWRYQPPEDVLDRQFGAMALFCGYDDVSQFALMVEAQSQEERRELLEKWQAHRRKALGITTRSATS